MLRRRAIRIAHRKINHIFTGTPFSHFQLVHRSKNILRQPLDLVKLYFVKHSGLNGKNCLGRKKVNRLHHKKK
jgi:hypothetical protein